MREKTLVEGKYYRVMPKVKLHHIDGAEPIFMEEPLFKGLSIEEKQTDDTYIVIQFINSTSHGVEIENVYTRFMGVLEFKDKDLEEYFKRVQEYYNCLLFAQEALKDLTERENEGHFEESLSEENNRIFVTKDLK